MKPLPRLYAIADASFGDPSKLAHALFDGGVQLLQVRNKEASARRLFDQVEEIIKMAPADACVIVNDRVDIALTAGAAGVHLGQTDLPAAAARFILGNDSIVGFSTHNLPQALEANNLPVDYVAVGPIFATSTKPNADPVVGLEGLTSICKVVQKPVVAIGGIQLENVREVFDAGAHSVAVIRGLLSASDVEARVLQWIQIMRSLSAG